LVPVALSAPARAAGEASGLAAPVEDGHTTAAGLSGINLSGSGNDEGLELPLPPVMMEMSGECVQLLFWWVNV